MDIPEELVQAFYDRRAVLFLSAGCSVPSGIPSADELAQQVALGAHAGRADISLEDFKVKTFGSNNPSLDQVAEHFYKEDGGSLDRFCRLARFSDWLRPPNEAHAGVVRLALEDFYDNVITTNWDTLIETAASNFSCRLSRIRHADELDLSGDVDLRLFKIHGCTTQHTSIIAAASQIDDDSQYFWWAKHQVEAAFEGHPVVFVGYSGSIERISRSMAKLAAWSPAGIKHYVVDRNNWARFRERAPEFVEAARVTEDEFFEADAESFLGALVDRLVRRLVLEIVNLDGPGQFQDLFGSLPSQATVAFQPDPGFVNAIACGDGAEAIMRALLRTVDVYPPLRSHRSLLARTVAWIAYLGARGWAPVDGLPAMRKNGMTVYFAAGEMGSPATKVRHHVLGFWRRKGRSHRRTIIGDDEAAIVICILIGVAGDLAQLPSEDLAVDAPANDLTRGEWENLRFATESEFLREEQNT